MAQPREQGHNSPGTKGQDVGHSPRHAMKRAAVLGAAATATLALSGCSQTALEQWGRAGLPEGASDRAPHIGNLWVGAWIASMLIGLFVWGLMAYVAVRYRRRHRDEVPRQSRYNLPMEILYTLVPFLIIGVLFFFTVKAQNAVNSPVAVPRHTVNVVGQKWSWTFNYMERDGVVHEVGTIEKTPDLYLVVDQPVRINLASADVIHSFWVPAFYYKLDVIPGKPNSFDVTPTKEGTFAGKCAELCGAYHSAMLFNVHVVSEEEYNAKMRELRDKGMTGEIKPPDGTHTLPTTTPTPTGEEHR